MTTIASNLELDDEAISALQALCKETRMNPSKAIQTALLAYRRMRANEKYLGKGELNPAQQSFQQGWKEALSGEIQPIETLWDDLDYD